MTGTVREVGGLKPQGNWEPVKVTAQGVVVVEGGQARRGNGSWSGKGPRFPGRGRCGVKRVSIQTSGVGAWGCETGKCERYFGLVGQSECSKG